MIAGQCIHYGDGKSNCPEHTPCCFQGFCDESAGDVNKEVWYSSELVNYAKISGGNLVLGLKPQEDLSATGQGSTVYFSRWVDHGKITISAKSGCKSPGVVSSFIVRNEFGDEIDFEWVGKDTSNVQTNYYYNNELDYTKMVPSPNLGDTTSKFIDYTIDWQLDSISWYVAGNLVRTVRRSDTWSVAENVFKFPDRPAQLSFSIWDGSNGRPDGTRDWAGYPISYSPDTEYDFNIANVQIKCMYNGNDTYVIPTRNSDESTATNSNTESDTDTATSSKSLSTSKASKPSSTSIPERNNFGINSNEQNGPVTIVSPISSADRITVKGNYIYAGYIGLLLAISFVLSV
ncbi:putative glycosidase CRR1 [Smittium culicis]|uniref:Putative glycosidase CRR1 n=1 Tax=Smittium culicis TaxID=133412 RepID=A0A1R1XK46_9FUNG|nr:putative glycosidase CRR1 [Smittium culicis]